MPIEIEVPNHLSLTKCRQFDPIVSLYGFINKFPEIDKGFWRNPTINVDNLLNIHENRVTCLPIATSIILISVGLSVKRMSKRLVTTLSGKG